MIANLSNLNQFRNPTVEAQTLAAMLRRPSELLAGHIGAVGFVVTVEDGGRRLGLSVSAGAGRATMGHAAALARHVGLAPPVTARRLRGGSLYWEVCA